MSHVTAYFEALDGERHGDAYAMLAPAVRAQATLDQFTAVRQQAIAAGGRVTSRNLVGVHWYPGQAQGGTGLAVAVDYLATTDEDVTICGYLVWLEVAEGRYAMLRDDSSSFTREQIDSRLAGMSEAQLRQVLSPPACQSLFRRS